MDMRRNGTLAGLLLAAGALAGLLVLQSRPAAVRPAPAQRPVLEVAMEPADIPGPERRAAEPYVGRTDAAPALEPEASIEAGPPAPALEGALRVRVSLDGEPLSGLLATVSHPREESAWQLRVPADGEPHPVPRGPIRVALPRTDLPALTALQESEGRVWFGGEGIAIDAHARRGEIAEASFDLVRGARLYGVVRGADGRGFAAAVRATGERGTYDAPTETGAYSLFLPPGSYHVTSYATHSAAPRVMPFPSLVDLEPGDQIALDLVYDQGSVWVVGRWIDQEGKPWTDLIVSAEPQEIGDPRYRATSDMGVHYVPTDAQGAYRLGPLPPGRYRISPSVREHELAGPGGFARHPERLEVLLTSADTLVDVGERTAIRWLPLELAGKVVAPEGAALYRYRLEVLAPTPVGGEPQKRPVALRRDGTFTLELSAHEPLSVTFVLTGPEGESRETFSFDSGGLLAITLRPRS